MPVKVEVSVNLNHSLNRPTKLTEWLVGSDFVGALDALARLLGLFARQVVGTGAARLDAQRRVDLAQVLQKTDIQKNSQL